MSRVRFRRQGKSRVQEEGTPLMILPDFPTKERMRERPIVLTRGREEDALDLTEEEPKGPPSALIFLTGGAAVLSCTPSYCHSRTDQPLREPG
jgi:hypothetical protein